MADTEVPNLAAATVPLNGDEVTYVVQGGVSKRVSASDVRDHVPPTALPTWRAAYANRRFAKAVIAGIGDSTMEGMGVDDQYYTWLARLADRLSANESEKPTVYRPALTKQFLFVNTWSFPGAVTAYENIGIGRRSEIVPSGGSATTTFYGTSCDLHFGADIFQGTVGITIDGIAQTGMPNVNQSPALDGIIWSSPLFPRGWHTVTITATGNDIRVEGIKPYDMDETYGVHVYEGGNSGSTAAQWQASNSGTSNWANAYAAINPHLLVISLVLNDYNSQNDPVTYKSNLQSMISTIRSYTTTVDPDVILVIPPQRGDMNDATQTYKWAQYVQANYDIAGTDPTIRVVNIEKLGLPAPGSADTYDYYSDLIHPNDKGNQRWTDLLCEAMDWHADRSINRSNLGSAPFVSPTVDYVTTTPPSPTTGIKVFSRHRARRLPAFVGPSGLDSSLQPALFANRVARWNATPNATVPTQDGIIVTHLNNATATPAAVAVGTTNFYSSMVRQRFNTTAVAGVGAGLRSAVQQFFLSSTPNMGGFFFVARFGLGAITATNRLFIGLSATTTALSPTVDPSTYLNMIGFASNSAHTNFRFMYNGGGTATQVDLGANYPTNSAATNFFEFRMFAPSGAGSLVYYSATRLNDGVTTQGSVNTNLPALGQTLAPHLHHSNGTTAAVASIDIQSLYIETDN